MGLRARMVGLLAALVALNAAFVVAVLWAYGVFLPTVVAGTFVLLEHGHVSVDLLRLPVSWPVVLVLVCGFLAVEVYYGYQRVLAGTRGVRGEDEHAVAEIVSRLAMAVDVPAPAVRVVDDETPSCYTVGRLTDATIVVTTGLVDRLDAAELEAVLAHELAHVVNRDVTLMTVTTLFFEVAARAARGARLAWRALFGDRDLSTRGSLALTWFLPLIVLTSVFVAPILAAFPPLARRATRRLAHAREFAADAAAARTTGDPLALATALTTLADATPTPETDYREAGMQALCILPAEPVTGAHTSTLPAVEAPADPAGRDARLTAWLDGTTPAHGPADGTETHPPIAARIRRLQALAAELEGAA